MRANANKRRQTQTNASKRRGENASKRKQTRANVDKRKQTLTPPFIAVFCTPFCSPLKLSRNYPHRGANLEREKRGKKALSCGGETVWETCLGESNCESKSVSRQWGDNSCRETSRCLAAPSGSRTKKYPKPQHVALHARKHRKLTVPKVCVFGCVAFSGALFWRPLTQRTPPY